MQRNCRSVLTIFRQIPEEFIRDLQYLKDNSKHVYGSDLLRMVKESFNEVLQQRSVSLQKPQDQQYSYNVLRIIMSLAVECIEVIEKAIEAAEKNDTILKPGMFLTKECTKTILLNIMSGIQDELSNSNVLLKIVNTDLHDPSFKFICRLLRYFSKEVIARTERMRLVQDRCNQKEFRNNLVKMESHDGLTKIVSLTSSESKLDEYASRLDRLFEKWSNGLASSHDAGGNKQVECYNCSLGKQQLLNTISRYTDDIKRELLGFHPRLEPRGPRSESKPSSKTLQSSPLYGSYRQSEPTSYPCSGSGADVFLESYDTKNSSISSENRDSFEYSSHENDKLERQNEAKCVTKKPYIDRNTLRGSKSAKIIKRDVDKTAEQCRKREAGLLDISKILALGDNCLTNNHETMFARKSLNRMPYAYYVGNGKDKKSKKDKNMSKSWSPEANPYTNLQGVQEEAKTEEQSESGIPSPLPEYSKAETPPTDETKIESPQSKGSKVDPSPPDNVRAGNNPTTVGPVSLTKMENCRCCDCKSHGQTKSPAVVNIFPCCCRRQGAEGYSATQTFGPTIKQSPSNPCSCPNSTIGGDRPRTPKKPANHELGIQTTESLMNGEPKNVEPTDSESCHCTDSSYNDLLNDDSQSQEKKVEDTAPSDTECDCTEQIEEVFRQFDEKYSQVVQEIKSQIRAGNIPLAKPTEKPQIESSRDCRCTDNNGPRGYPSSTSKSHTEALHATSSTFLELRNEISELKRLLKHNQAAYLPCSCCQCKSEESDINQNQGTASEPSQTGHPKKHTNANHKDGRASHSSGQPVENKAPALASPPKRSAQSNQRHQDARDLPAREKEHYTAKKEPPKATFVESDVHRKNAQSPELVALYESTGNLTSPEMYAKDESSTGVGYQSDTLYADKNVSGRKAKSDDRATSRKEDYVPKSNAPDRSNTLKTYSSAKSSTPDRSKAFREYSTKKSYTPDESNTFKVFSPPRPCTPDQSDTFREYTPCPFFSEESLESSTDGHELQNVCVMVVKSHTSFSRSEEEKEIVSLVIAADNIEKTKLPRSSKATCDETQSHSPSRKRELLHVQTAVKKLSRKEPYLYKVERLTTNNEKSTQYEEYAAPNRKEQSERKVADGSTSTEKWSHRKGDRKVAKWNAIVQTSGPVKFNRINLSSESEEQMAAYLGLER